ncbi:MAG: trypsin-like peptidase domain-containing protein [Thermoflexales bacterium]|nr:trypsin-like peptidase domain-containing protein [Thermoflexales bacterium]
MDETEQRNRVTCGMVALLAVLGLCVGSLGGAAAGGAVAYGLLSSQPAAPPVSVSAPAPVVASTPQVSPLRLDTSSAVVDAVSRVQPAVVTVLNTQQAQRIRTFWGIQLIQPKSSGSGVIISAEGYIVTNNHVVENAETLEVVYADGSKAAAHLVGADPYADTAVIKVEGRVPAVAEFGDSSALKIGETVIAIGSALGDFKNTVTVGVVSAMDRQLDTGQGYALEGMIQTDAAINHGNSGGPLVNVLGQVVGINTAIVRSDQSSGDVAEGLGFAVPSVVVSDLSAQIIAKGYVDRPYLGIRYQMITPEIAGANGLPMEWGVYVADIERGAPAAQGGLRPGDIITAIGDAQISAELSYINALNRHRAGERVTLTFWRDGRTQTAELTLGSQAR